MATEIKATLETGVLKNHHNDTFTRLTRNTARATHTYKKAQETHQQKKALNIVDEELASLKNSQKENAARIRELKATKSNIAKKGKSLKAQLNSSGKVVATSVTVSKSKRAEKASRVATIKEGTFYIQSVFVSFKFFFPPWPAGIFHKRTMKSKQVELEETDPGPILKMSMDTASTQADSTNAGNLDDITIDFNYSKFPLFSRQLSL